MPPRVLAIIQARMRSTRLPGKVLLQIGDRPMLARVYARVSRAQEVHQVVVATTEDASDDPVAGFCREAGIDFTRGSQHDVLDRYYQAALGTGPDAVVRITADCPVVDPQLIDACVQALFAGRFDFTCNRLPPPYPRSYPIGLDTEVCTLAALEQAWRLATERFHREHVVPFLYEGVRLEARSPQLSAGISSRGFSIAMLNHVPDLGSLRWTVDTAEDLAFIREVFARFEGRDDFTWLEVLDLVRDDPDLAAINATVRHKSLYDE